MRANYFADRDDKYSITDTENMSVLTVKYKDINEIRNKFADPDGNNKKFQCKAINDIGEAKTTFEVNVGKLPETPILANYSYDNGMSIFYSLI